MSDMSEKAFEALIEKSLVGTTREERGSSARIDNQLVSDDKFYWGSPSDLDVTHAIDTRRLWSFLWSTQADELNNYVKDTREKDILERISKRIATFGVLDVLRNGVKIDNINLRLYYPIASSSDDETARAKFDANQFSVTRQVVFSKNELNLELDMAVYVNGLPLLTMELKNPYTHQSARVEGCAQYRKRNYKEPLLSFGRTLAHFTLDCDEVYFTTRLQGEETNFMPFNKGFENGAGNPVNPNGHKTAYFWEEILTKRTLGEIIANYALVDYDADTPRTQRQLRNAKRIIFPRYHQIDVVRRLVGDIEENGVGKRYLIEHSAGSGKSNSLTWLAYRLLRVNATGANAHRVKEPLFDSVVIVTDRRILDRQITDNVKAFGQSDGLVKHADKSEDLKNALQDGTRIIITTIQKFPFVCETIDAGLQNRNFAVIIDEAHSSQSGIAADTLNAVLKEGEDLDKDDIEEIVLQVIAKRKMNDNCSYFAFTATPKKETLERFGIKDANGAFHPFHLYSMKQAIEEGFILDVLSNYSTYQSYYELTEAVKGNPLFKSRKAQRVWCAKVQKNPTAIEVKAGIMLDHFDMKVVGERKLAGLGKGMVVTHDIERAIRYYQALTKLVNKMKLGYRVLIAFSGEKKVDGEIYTEAQMNGFPDTQTAAEFGKDDARLLVVANKYLTGFDQPKLCAMYVDKPLDGVLAVQALSRLNRAAPWLGKKSDNLSVLDFFNKVDDIKKAFDPYYTSTALSESTNLNVLNDLQDELLNAGVYDKNDVDEFTRKFFTGASAEELSPIVDRAVKKFDELDKEKCQELDANNARIDFKMKAKQFVRVYSKAAAIMTYERTDWEKLHWFLKMMIPKLRVKIPGETDFLAILNAVDLSKHAIRMTSQNTAIVLKDEEGVLDPNKPVMVNGGDDNEPMSPLDRLIEEFNQHHFAGWTATPEEQKIKISKIVERVREYEEFKLIEESSNESAKQRLFDQLILMALLNERESDMSLYRECQTNQSFKNMFYALVKNATKALVG